MPESESSYLCFRGDIHKWPRAKWVPPKMSRFRYALGLAALLAGCAASQNMTWIRGDGQAMLGDAVLMRQFDVDRTICFGQQQKAAVDAIARGCMAQRGYLLVPKNEAAARLAERAALAAEKACRDAFAAKKNNFHGE